MVMWQKLKIRWYSAETKLGAILKNIVGPVIMILTAIASLSDEITAAPDLIPHWLKVTVFGAGLLVSLYGKLTKQ